MMKRFFLFIGLSLFYTSAMVVMGGYNVSSDAAQLWNSQKNNDSSSGSSYYNSQTPSNENGRHNLFNSNKAESIHRKDTSSDRMAYDYLKYENRQRSKDRAPAIFQYMSPYAVAKRLDNIELALMRQSERKKASAARLKKMQAESEKYDFHKFSQDNRAKLFARIASVRGGVARKPREDRDAGSRRVSDTSGAGSPSAFKPVTTTSDVGGSTQLFNARNASQSQTSNDGKKTRLFNSSN